VQTLQREISLAKNRQRIGDREEVLVEGTSKLKAEQIMGRTRANRIVNLTGSTSLIGEFVQVRIIGGTANSLLGELMCANAAIESQQEGDRQ
jgi:tRNA-2-methylthio-N6-dimethylallyladenosine synthase